MTEESTNAQGAKAVLITGCSTGIGRATALQLAQRGDFVVYATARRLETVEDLAEAGCRTLSLDVTDEDSMQAAVDAVESEHGSVWALINNAGYSQSGAVESIPLESLRDQFETNVFGLIRMAQLVLPGMRNRGEGRIVNLGSMGGKFTFPGGGAYHATKYSVEAISDALRFEVSGFGVRVVLIEPGLITTSFGDTAVGSIDAAPSDGPYGKFNAGVGKVMKGAYEGPLAKLGAGPEAVAKKIETALTSSNPRPRYTVTPSAKVIIAMRRLTSDRMWDRMVGMQFRRPGS